MEDPPATHTAAVAALPPTGAVSTAPVEWLFLSKWFTILGEAHVALVKSDTFRPHAIRIGGDSEDDSDNSADVWLEVTLNRSYLSVNDAYDSDHDEEDPVDNPWPWSPTVEARVASLRDAIILTSFVGKVDYDGWWEMMEAFTHVHVVLSMRGIRGAAPRLPIRYLFSLGANHNTHFLKWSKCLGRLMGDLSHTEEYVEDLASIQRELGRRSVSWMDVEPTPLKLALSFEAAEGSSQDLSARVMRIVDGIHHTERLLEEARDNGTSPGTLFCVADMEGCFARGGNDDHVIEALTNLLQTGVRFSAIRLPALDSYRQPNFKEWGTFIRLLTGVEADDQGRLVSARCIEVPSSYARRPHFALLCSALAYARGVKVLVLQSHLDVNHFRSTETERSRSWRWLAFALFSKVSATSVTKLIIQGESPRSMELPAIKEIVESDNPFQVLSTSTSEYGVAFPVLDPHFRSLMTTIRPRAIFRVASGSSARDCYHVKEMWGELLSQPDDAGERVIFIPGYGLCLGQLSDRPNKRVKTEPATERITSSCAHLVIGETFTRMLERTCLVVLLEIVGKRLRGLSLSVESGDEVLRRVFELCPNLESLETHGLVLSSMDVLRQGYANGAKISSLNLEVGDTATADLHEFFGTFLQKRPPKDSAAFHIERLQVDFGHFHLLNAETVQLIENVLRENRTMTHFYSLTPHMWWTQSKFDGLRIPGLTDDQKLQLIAFLGGMRAVALSNSALHMDGHVKRHIYEFAVEPRHRRVLW